MASQVEEHQAGPGDSAIAKLIFDPVARADPYPVYDELRSFDPVFQSSLGAWFVTSYEECARLLRDPALVRRHEDSWEMRAQINNCAGRKWFEHQSRWMLWLDPPEHTKLRGLVAKAFTPRYVERVRPRILEVVDALIDGIEEQGRVDLIAELAFPLPITIICDMLGVPLSDRDRFRGGTVAMAATLEPLPSAEVQDRADEATYEFEDYLRSLIDRRRANLGDDLLSRLIEAEDSGETLTDDDIIATVALLLGAGFETTTNLIGNGTLALLNNPEQWKVLVDDPAASRHAVDELLRYDSSVQLATPRVASEPVELGGHTIAPGELVAPVVAGANRDPARYERPNELDLDRPDPAPLSFGGGAHFCLGASLARLEGALVFEAMARRLPGLHLADEEPKFRPGLNLRGLESLDVTPRR